jgi:hypothetical protein
MHSTPFHQKKRGAQSLLPSQNLFGPITKDGIYKCVLYYVNCFKLKIKILSLGVQNICCTNYSSLQFKKKTTALSLSNLHWSNMVSLVISKKPGQSPKGRMPLLSPSFSSLSQVQRRQGLFIYSGHRISHNNRRRRIYI